TMPAEPLATLPSSIFAGFAVLGTAMVSVLFTYDGYADAVYLAGETRDPSKLPRILVVSLLSVTALYVLANCCFLAGLGADGMARSKFVGFELARSAFGEAGERAYVMIAVLVMAGAVNSYLMTGPRIARLLAEER